MTFSHWTVVVMIGLMGGHAQAAPAEEAKTQTQTQSQAETQKQVAHIRQVYAATEKALPKCQKVTRDLEGESAEGGELTAFLLQEQVVKLTALYLGETGRMTQDFYFDAGHLVFVLRTTERYDKPLSGVVQSRAEERFYLGQDKLLRWLDADGQAAPLPSAAGTEIESTLVKSAADLRALAGKKATP